MFLIFGRADFQNFFVGHGTALKTTSLNVMLTQNTSSNSRVNLEQCLPLPYLPHQDGYHPLCVSPQSFKTPNSWNVPHILPTLPKEPKTLKMTATITEWQRYARGTVKRIQLTGSEKSSDNWGRRFCEEFWVNIYPPFNIVKVFEKNLTCYSHTYETLLTRLQDGY